MKTGIELITIEREEQIKKHDYDSVHDDGPWNGDGELADVATLLLLDAHEGAEPPCASALYPETWEGHVKEKLDSKSRIQNLIVAGALVAAEIDRLIRAGVTVLLVFGVVALSGCISPVIKIEDSVRAEKMVSASMQRAGKALENHGKAIETLFNNDRNLENEILKLKLLLATNTVKEVDQPVSDPASTSAPKPEE